MPRPVATCASDCASFRRSRSRCVRSWCATRSSCSSLLSSSTCDSAARRGRSASSGAAGHLFVGRAEPLLQLHHALRRRSAAADTRVRSAHAHAPHNDSMAGPGKERTVPHEQLEAHAHAASAKQHGGACLRMCSRSSASSRSTRTSCRSRSTSACSSAAGTSPEAHLAASAAARPRNTHTDTPALEAAIAAL